MAESSTKKLASMICPGFFMLLFIWNISGHLKYTNGEIREYCIQEEFKPQCGDEEVIVMTHAFYGRMRLGRCVTRDLGYIGCKTDALHILDTLCSNKNHCNLDVVDLTTHKNMHSPCVEGLYQYLEADYTCQKVIRIESSTCQSTAAHYEITSRISVSSEQLARARCGTSSLNFAAKSGQKLNISIVDFSRDVRFDSMKSCVNYLELKDKSASEQIPVCAGSVRSRHVMVTTENEVTAIFQIQDPNNQRFLLQFQAIGCADITPPEGTWVQRDGDETTLGCHSGKHTWTLRCEHNQWVGAVGSCGTGLAVTKAMLEPEPQSTELASGMLAFAVCAVFLLIASSAFTVGVCIYTNRAKYPASRIDQNSYLHNIDALNKTQTLHLLPSAKEQTSNQRKPRLPEQSPNQMQLVQNAFTSGKTRPMYPTQSDEKHFQTQHRLPLGNTIEKEQEYINTTSSMTDSIYSDSVKYYVLENLNDPRNS